MIIIPDYSTMLASYYYSKIIPGIISSGLVVLSQPLDYPVPDDKWCCIQGLGLHAPDYIFPY